MPIMTELQCGYCRKSNRAYGRLDSSVVNVMKNIMK
jgi:hypothetical protein